MGDMMHEGHVWRGMVYGMTTRFRCADPTPLWRLWDSFGMANASMHGYWEAKPPAVSSCEGVLVTAYVRRGRAVMLAIASWAHEQQSCSITLDWAALGLEAAAVRASLPDLSALGQMPTTLELKAADGYMPTVGVGAGEGGVLIVETTR